MKRREQSGHWRRLRIDVPSSVVRLSTTRLSGCLQKGQCMVPHPSLGTTESPLRARCGGIALPGLVEQSQAYAIHGARETPALPDTTRYGWRRPYNH
ncbi:hypothetical protein GCM10009731_26440 [Streptomyces globosus]